MTKKKPKLRQYQPIWNTLRDAVISEIAKGNTRFMPTIQVTCPPQHRKRVRKAVIKEKYIDDWPDKYFFKLESEFNHAGIKFTLVNYRLNQVISEKL